MASGGKEEVVVIAVDGSEHSDYTLKWYRENIYRPSHKVFLVHCVEYKSVFSTSALSTDPTGLNKQIEEQDKITNALVEKIAQDIATLQLSGIIEKTFGEEPGHAIVHYAQEKNASFIVIGSRGKGTLRRTITGSVTDYVVHHSTVPVFVCRHKDSHHHHFHLPNPFHRSKHDKKHEDGQGQKKDG